MEISGKDFQELFQNPAASIHLFYQSKMAPFALNNTLFDARIFNTILAGLFRRCMRHRNYEVTSISQSAIFSVLGKCHELCYLDGMFN